MRGLYIVLICYVLSGCAGNTANYYTQKKPISRAEKSADVIRRLGQPDIQMPAPSGGTYLVYKTKRYRTYPVIVPPIGTFVGNTSRPIIYHSPSNNSTGLNKEQNSVTCTTIFQVNSQGIITATQKQGLGCS